MTTECGKATVTVNGKSVALQAASLGEMLTQLGYARERAGIAVALNGRVIPRSAWDDERPRDGDAIEIVGAVQGG